MTAQIVWHSFLQSVPADQRTSLEKSLSSEVLSELQGLAAPMQDIHRGVKPIEEELSSVHYSWLSPFLRALPENEIKLFLASLPPEQIKGLKQSLLLSNTLPALLENGKDFLRKTLFETVAPDDIVPTACLPAEPLNCLLELSPAEFDSLIDLLSMHDLSVEIRQIIETAKLKQIYALLTKPQTTFLKTLLHKKEAVTFKKMGLIAWRGDKDALRSLLLQRGLNRIAKSLYGRHPSLLWHVAHRLDAEKGQLLLNLCTALDHPRASSLLSEQVVELVHALKSNNPPQNL
jgi:hypothetical protein